MVAYKYNGIDIEANKIDIGKRVTFGTNVKVSIKGNFTLGDYSHLGNCEIYGNNISFGKHLFCSGGLRIGGGGRNHPNANLTIGDRCTIHNNFLNVCEPIVIGNDVGLSPEVSILTHGYWLSVLEGFPATFKGVKIGNGVIVGYRSLIMMGVKIANECVIGAQSVVTKSLVKRGVYAGSPASFIREIKPLTQTERLMQVGFMLTEYLKIAEYHGLKPFISVSYPWVQVEEMFINLETFEYEGKETGVTDDFRDYIRKWGIRIYTERPFKSA